MGSMSMPGKVVIVGAGAGGDATAMSLRKQGFEGEIVLIGMERRRPYERPYLSKQFLRSEVEIDRVYLRPEAEYEQQGITLITGRSAVRASAGPREIILDDGARIPFETLVLAPGSTARWLPDVPHAANVYTLRSLDDCLDLKAGLDQSRRLLLLGAGFIGAEIAASARQLGKGVIMVELATVPLERALGREVGEVYARLHRSRGVDLRAGTSVVDWIVEGDRLVAVQLSDGSREEVDMAVIGVGVIPNVDLGRDLGLELGQGGVLVDETLRAGDGIYAVGDIAAHLHPVFGRHVRAEHWQVAQKQGTAVGAAIAQEPTEYRELPWFWSDQYDVNLQYVGNAVDFDRIAWRGDVEGEKFSVFYMKDGTIDAVLSVNDGRTGRLSRELISRRLAVDEAVLRDTEVDLRELASA